MARHVLAYNHTRVMNIFGVRPLPNRSHENKTHFQFRLDLWDATLS
jgi:hypothetical protein